MSGPNHDGRSSNGDDPLYPVGSAPGEQGRPVGGVKASSHDTIPRDFRGSKKLGTMPRWEPSQPMPGGNANATELALESILTQNQTPIRPVCHYYLSFTIFILLYQNI